MADKAEWRQRFQRLKQVQALSLEDKVEQTRKLLFSVLRQHKRPAIAWSGGKDSTVLLHLVLEQKPDIDVVWVNTGVEFPECVRFIQDLKIRWNLNLHIAKPETTFWKVVDKYGWPMLGKGGNGGWQSRAAYLERNGRTRLARATRDARIGAACCRLLKKNPAEKTYRQLGTDCVVLASMVAESRQRFFNWAHRGDYYYAPSENKYKAWPMAFWKDEDVWEYHSRFALPHSNVYDKGHRRNGCWPCLMDIRYEDNKLSILHRSHPKLWYFLIVKKGLGKRLLALKLALDEEEEATYRIENIDQYVSRLISQRPCYFDRL